MSKITNDGGLNPAGLAQDDAYSCTHMTTLGVKGLSRNWSPSGHCIVVFCDHAGVMSAPPLGGDQNKTSKGAVV